MKLVIFATLLFTFANCNAQNRHFEDWMLGTANNGTPFIATSNESGGLFGQWCDGENPTCFWVLANKTPCKPGVSAPALINTESGSTTVTVTCVSTTNAAGEPFYRNIVAPFNEVEKIVKGNPRISFALALEGDGFRILRYSLKGALISILEMERAKSNYMDSRNRKSTKDLTL